MSVTDVVAPREKPAATSNRKADLERIAVTIGSSLFAVVFALVVSGVILAIAGKDAFAAFSKACLSYGQQIPSP